jgi:adenosylmethionine-8-amino-7-oxononanoate aminotransferase
MSRPRAFSWPAAICARLCRADDRGDPVVQLAPPLVCTQEHFDEMEQILRSALTEAWARI